jgi:hypothetical protein
LQLHQHPQLHVLDVLPSGLVVAALDGAVTNCPSATLTAVAGSRMITLSGATLPAGGSCTVQVNIGATSTGNKMNTTSPISSKEGGSSSGGAQASILVTPN